MPEFALVGERETLYRDIERRLYKISCPIRLNGEKGKNMNEEMSRYLYQKLEKIISYLAYENKDFVCSACMHTMEELYSIAHTMLSFASACELRDIADEIMEDKENE